MKKKEPGFLGILAPLQKGSTTPGHVQFIDSIHAITDESEQPSQKMSVGKGIERGLWRNISV
jgi:hypothetical protein